MLKVEGHADLYRDENTSAIINKSQDYKKYVEARNKRLNQDKKIESLETEISEIKFMLNAILEKMK